MKPSVSGYLARMAASLVIVAALSSRPAAEERAQVVGQRLGVLTGAVDVGGRAGAQHRQAQDVEPGRPGDHAAVVSDAAGAVTHRDVEPGVVGPKTCRPHYRGDLPAGQVQLQRG